MPIALDWDRPWQVSLMISFWSPLRFKYDQAWPLTPAFGAITGYISSSIVALTVSSVVDLAEQHAKGQLDAAEQKKTK